MAARRGAEAAPRRAPDPNQRLEGWILTGADGTKSSSWTGSLFVHMGLSQDDLDAAAAGGKVETHLGRLTYRAPSGPVPR